MLAGGGGGKGQRGCLPTASRGAEDGEDGVRGRPGGEGGSVFLCPEQRWHTGTADKHVWRRHTHGECKATERKND